MMMDKSQAGFTLIEVMIALVIFSMIASTSVYSLRLAVNSRDQLGEFDAEMKQIQVSRVLIKEDLGQIVSRPVRDVFGQLNPSVLTGGQVAIGSRQERDEKILIEFVRGGRINPNAADPRSTLQHVVYVFRDRNLIRRSRPFLDAFENSRSFERVLIRDLEDAEFTFLSGEFRGELEWADVWPVPGLINSVPRAVTFTTEDKSGNSLRQVFWIGDLNNSSVQ